VGEKHGISFPAELDLMVPEVTKSIRNPVDEKPLNPEIKCSLMKMILGMAVVKYGYDPTASRNPAIARIRDSLAKVDIKLDEDTIRTRLREAADEVEDFSAKKDFG
jgi:hypothetical protein